jgi:hypothetical protein
MPAERENLGQLELLPPTPFPLRKTLSEGHSPSPKETQSKKVLRKLVINSWARGTKGILSVQAQGNAGAGVREAISVRAMETEREGAQQSTLPALTLSTHFPSFPVAYSSLWPFASSPLYSLGRRLLHVLPDKLSFPLALLYPTVTLVIRDPSVTFQDWILLFFHIRGCLQVMP